MPYIPTETIVSAALLVALVAGWRYVQSNPETKGKVVKAAHEARDKGKDLFDDLDQAVKSGSSGASSEAAKKKKKQDKKKKKATAAAVSTSSSGDEKQKPEAPSYAAVADESADEPIAKEATAAQPQQAISGKAAKKAKKAKKQEAR